MQKENILLTKHRKSFRDSIKSVTDIPDLLSVQKESFNLLVQAAVDPDKRENIGLQKVFKASFPIEDYQGRASLSYVSYRVEEPKYSISECKLKGYNYQSAIYVKFDLCTWEYDLDENENPILETKRVKDIKQQEVFFGEIPIMTPNGAFVINGTERVIVNQLHRSPGVFFDAQRTAKDLTTTGKTSFTARIVPQDGRWLDFEFDSKDILFVRIDRKKKFHSTLLMLALGQDIKTILNNFYKKETIKFNGKEFLLSCDDGQEDHLKELSIHLDKKFENSVPVTLRMQALFNCILVFRQCSSLRAPVRDYSRRLVTLRWILCDALIHS